MTNLAGALKQEIARIARRTLRSELDTLKAQSGRHRTQIAKLGRELDVARKELSSLRRQVKTSASNAAPEDQAAGKKLRFSATRLAAMRKKQGLSAAQLGQLVQVSAQSIYSWESGKSRPRAAQLESIAKVRGLGKRELAARLEQLSAE